MITTYRVSENFAEEIKEIQKASKENGIAKTQEQIFDEMLEIYKEYLDGKINIYISEEMERSLININSLFFEKMGSMVNTVLDEVIYQNEKTNKRIDDLIEIIK